MKTPLLLNCLKVKPSKRELEAVQYMDEFDYSNVIRKTTEDLCKFGQQVDQEYLEEGIFALKQYYAVALFDPCNMHAVSDAVDPFWYAHILHTREYFEFCENVVGGYMHHDPLDHKKVRDIAHVKLLYGYTMQIYERLFSRINRKFNPSHLPEYRLVCTHYNVGYLPQDKPRFPMLPEMQPLGVSVRA